MYYEAGKLLRKLGWFGIWLGVVGLIFNDPLQPGAGWYHQLICSLLGIGLCIWTIHDLPSD